MIVFTEVNSLEAHNSPVRQFRPLKSECNLQSRYNNTSDKLSFSIEWGLPSWDFDNFLDISRHLKFSEVRKASRLLYIGTTNRAGAFITLKHIQGIFKMDIP